MTVPVYLPYLSTESSAESLASWNVRAERPGVGENPFSGPGGVRRAWDAWAGNFSSKTRGVYGEGLSWLARFLDIADPLDAVQHVASMGEERGARTLEDWENWLRDVRGNGPRTIKARRLAVRQAFRVLYACQVSNWIPDTPKRSNEGAEPVSDLGMIAAKRFAEQIKESTPRDWRAARDRAISWLAFGCGVSLSSISTLDISDCICKGDEIQIRTKHGKGEESFFKPLPPVALAVREWLKVRPSADGLLCLFPGNRTGGAQKIRWTRLDSRGIWALLRRRFDKSGYRVKLRKGGFRHSAILAALRNEEEQG